jgi:RecA-family ATPase
MVEGMIPIGNVTILGGDGGLGKSLLAQQLLTCVAIGKPWLGFPTQACRALGVFCEDDRDELHIRQAAINEHYGCQFADLGRVEWIPRVGEANVMMAFAGDGRGAVQPFYRQVCQRVTDFRPRLVVLDSLHDLFAGDENRRGAARQFIGALRSMILPVDGAVLLLSHPSLSGLNSGTGSAGSTAWNNAVRGRLYLTRPDGDAVERDERVLKTMKSNYGPTGGKIPLLWRHGVFVRQDAVTAAMSLVDKVEIDRVLEEALRELVKHDTRVAADPHAKNGFATLARKLPAAKHLSWQIVVAAQERLVSAGKVVTVEMGPSRNRLRAYLRTPDILYPGEAREPRK